MNTYTHEDLKSMSEDVKLAQFLRDIYKWEALPFGRSS